MLYDVSQELFCAAQEGAIEKVRQYISEGADVNWVSHGGFGFPWSGLTPLAAAIRKKDNLPVVRYLLENGADANIQSDTGHTPLHYAAMDGDIGYIQAMLKLPGINMNVSNGHGETPLHFAAMGGHTDAAKLLIRQGASISQRDHAGLSPGELADQRGHKELARFINKWAIQLRSGGNAQGVISR